MADATPISTSETMFDYKTIILNAKKMFVVRYKDAFSAGLCSFNDLMISVNHHIIGCGSQQFGKASPGDLALLVANRNQNEHDRVFCVGIIGEPRAKEHSTEWFENGGRLWDYNFHFTPITGVKSYYEWRKTMDSVCDDKGANKKNILHSRFGSSKCLKPFLLGMMDIPDFLSMKSDIHITEIPEESIDTDDTDDMVTPGEYPELAYESASDEDGAGSGSVSASGSSS